ncbi:MAG: biopolymer transporter ExbD [Flavobacteriaceae bacterium TMED200]|nr:biopolymer transporter ExbD [Flavobacteriaceae bacterium]OUW66260.1 MAG: biopolymer transporter ExbD [Flavobacteriaceae bacterium TMED200]|tara:strand:- start:34 stop:429 length:396 start_codon:yes stop_codon:yes gene_type:complete
MNFKTSNKITPNFSMSSMTDVVFLLLIFFMIASTLAKNLNTIDVKLPQAKGKSENRENVSVSIDSKNRFYIDGEFVRKNDINNKLITKLSKSNKRVIILRSDNKVPIKEIVYVMDIANKNSVKVVLAVKDK